VASLAAFAIVSSVFPQVALSIRVFFGCLRSHGVLLPCHQLQRPRSLGGDFHQRICSRVSEGDL